MTALLVAACFKSAPEVVNLNENSTIISIFLFERFSFFLRTFKQGVSSSPSNDINSLDAIQPTFCSSDCCRN